MADVNLLFDQNNHGGVQSVRSYLLTKSRNSVFRKFGKSEIWKFETSENRRIGNTQIQEIGKSERKGFLKNKRIIGMSVSCFFTYTSGFPGLLATFIVTGGRVGRMGRVGRCPKVSFIFFLILRFIKH